MEIFKISEISNDNINFFPADVNIDECLLYLSSDLVSNPKYVRHAWSDIATGAILIIKKFQFQLLYYLLNN